MSTQPSAVLLAIAAISSLAAFGGPAANAQRGSWCRGTSVADNVPGQVGIYNTDPEKNTIGFSCNSFQSATISSATALPQRVRQVSQVGLVTGDSEKDTFGYVPAGDQP
ncbi:hypothetical protein [Microvirga massiliensis]|uniref:hypothetical protein n=1 Tax=Microvirga massiliensis TaxID=1033741 RepID=UPI00062B9E3F|nr:hypothetical protein [Microvirga massiliensis]